jgi:hypothetical protein
MTRHNGGGCQYGGGGLDGGSRQDNVMTRCGDERDGMVHTWVGQKVMPINLIVRQYAYVKVMFWYFFTYDELRQQETATHNTNTEQTLPPWRWSHLPLQRRGFDESMPAEGWQPCAYSVQGRC